MGGAVTILQKMYQGCTMFTTPLMYDLIRAAGGAASTWRYVRTHVNGQYFRYQIQVERGGSRLIERINDEYNARCIDHPRETVGDLYKAQGCGCTECGYKWCSGDPLSGNSDYTALQFIANS